MAAISRFQERNFLSWIRADGYRASEPQVIPYLLDLMEMTALPSPLSRLLRAAAGELRIDLSPEGGLHLVADISPRTLLRFGVQRDALDSVLEALSWQVPHAVVAFWKQLIGDPLPAITVYTPGGMLTLPVTSDHAALIARLEAEYGPIRFVSEWSLGETTTGAVLLKQEAASIPLPLAATVEAGFWLPLPAIGERCVRLVRAYPLGFDECDLMEELLWLEMEQQGFVPVRSLPLGDADTACLHRVAEELHWWLQYLLVHDRIRETGVPCDEYGRLGIAPAADDPAPDPGEILLAANLPALCQICGEHPGVDPCPAEPHLSCHQWKGELMQLVHRHGYATPRAQLAVVRDFMAAFVPFVRRRHHEQIRRLRRLRRKPRALRR